LLELFSETDQTEKRQAISVPVPVMHSDNDAIVPFADSGPLAAKLLKNGRLKVYKDLPHGMPTTRTGLVNADLLAAREARRLVGASSRCARQCERACHPASIEPMSRHVDDEGGRYADHGADEAIAEAFPKGCCTARPHHRAVHNAETATGQRHDHQPVIVGGLAP
jgi:hypothetical protein